MIRRLRLQDLPRLPGRGTGRSIDRRRDGKAGAGRHQVKCKTGARPGDRSAGRAHSIYLDTLETGEDISTFKARNTWNRVERELISYEGWFRDACEQWAIDAEKKAEADTGHALVIPDIDELDEEEDAPSRSEAAPPSQGVVVVRSIGNPSTSEGKRVIQGVRRSPPISRSPSNPFPISQLFAPGSLASSPMRASVIDTLLYGLVGRPHVWFRPTLLLGSPGCGKTRFARLLAEELAAPYELISCGGLSDKCHRWHGKALVVRRTQPRHHGDPPS